MERLTLVNSQLSKNSTFRKDEPRVETMLAQHYPYHSVVQFNRPRYMNTINVNMVTWINRFIDYWNSNPNVKVTSDQPFNVNCLLGVYLERGWCFVLCWGRSRSMERAV